jgi:hypothetical protein
MLKKVLIVLLFACPALCADEENQEDVVLKGKRCKTYSNLIVCNNLTAGNLAVRGTLSVDDLSVTGDETIDGDLTIDGVLTGSGDLAITGTSTLGGPVVVNGAETINGDVAITGTLGVAGLLSLVTPNVLDYGYFYTQIFGSATQNIIFTAAPGVNVGTDAYTPVTGGVMVTDAGIYLMSFYGVFVGNTDFPITLGLSVNGGVTYIPGSVFGFNGNSTGVSVPVSGTALVSLGAGQIVQLYSMSDGAPYFVAQLTATAPISTNAAFCIVRLR